MDDVPIIDRTRLELITRGNAARADEFLAALLEEAEDILAGLQTLLAGEDRGAVKDAAHTLKGMSAEVGALRLRAAAAALETEAEPARRLDRLNAINAALAELRSHLSANATPNGSV